MHNPIGTKITPHTPELPGGGKIPTFLGCEGDFSPKSTFFVGALTAFRDFIHRFPRKCKFSSSLGANSTSQSMETTSELLWFCRGKCGIIAGKGGKIPPGSIPGTHREREGESHIPVLPRGQIPTFFKTFSPFSTQSSPNLLGFVLFFSSKFSLGKERSRSLGAEQSPRSPSVPSINGVLFAVAERRNKNQRMEGLQNPLKIPASTCPSHVHGPSLFQVFPCFGISWSRDQPHGGEYQVWGAGQVLLRRGSPVVSGVPPDAAGRVFLREKPMEFQHGHRDRGDRFPVLPSQWNWGSPAPPRLCWSWG